MKTLAPIQIGTFTVNIAIEEHKDADCLWIHAELDGMKLKHCVHFQGTHAHTENQFLNDIQNAAQGVAEELASKARAKDLRDKFLSTP
jgi:hypothetical protein